MVLGILLVAVAVLGPAFVTSAPVPCNYNYLGQYFFYAENGNPALYYPAQGPQVCQSVGLAWANVTNAVLPYLWALQFKCYGFNSTVFFQNYQGLPGPDSYWVLSEEYVENSASYDGTQGALLCQVPGPLTTTDVETATEIETEVLSVMESVTTTLISQSVEMDTAYSAIVVTQTIVVDGTTTTTVCTTTTVYKPHPRYRPDYHPRDGHAHHNYNHSHRRRRQSQLHERKRPRQKPTGTEKAGWQAVPSGWSVCSTSLNNFYVISYDGAQSPLLPDAACNQVLGPQYVLANMTLPILDNLQDMLGACEVDYATIAFWYQYQALCAYISQGPALVGFLDFDAPDLLSGCILQPQVICYQGPAIAETRSILTGPTNTVTQTSNVATTTQTSNVTVTDTLTVTTTQLTTTTVQTVVLEVTVTTTTTDVVTTETETATWTVCKRGQPTTACSCQCPRAVCTSICSSSSCRHTSSSSCQHTSSSSCRQTSSSSCQHTSSCLPAQCPYHGAYEEKQETEDDDNEDYDDDGSK
jgi:hypothetical protein